MLLRIGSFLGSSASTGEGVTGAKSLLQGNEGFAFDFLTRTAVIRDNAGILTAEGTPGLFLTTTRSGATAGYIDSDKLFKTASANTLRYHHNPLTGAARGILVEPTDTNYKTKSEDISDVSFTKNETTVSANSTVFIDGTTVADTLTVDVAATEPYVQASASRTGITARSAFLKQGTAPKVLFDLRTTATASTVDTYIFDFATKTFATVVSTAAVSAIGYEEFDGGIFRLWAKGVAQTGQSAVSMRLAPVNASDGYTDGQTLIVCGIEIKDRLTSYVKTDASTVARNADVITMATSGLPAMASQGTLFVEVEIVDAAASSFPALIALAGATPTTDTIVILWRPTSDGKIACTVRAGGVATVDRLAGEAKAAGDIVKAALRYSGTEVRLCVDGSLSSLDTAFTLPTLASLRIGGGVTGTNPAWCIRRAMGITREMTDAEMQSLTS